ncbi:hypothetical protein WJX72_006063 [[Myrmecia] bisecta]|uniref:BZIP domain-containing protein n=1 Tax=[Myrmecia] bisecta TaxID=41462 RepID=A0AAW1QQQ2_9CHLO
MHEDAEQHKGVSTAHLGRLEAGMSLGSSGDPSSQPDVNPDSGANRRAAGAKDADAAAQRALEAEKRRLKINRESARRVRQRRQEFIERTTQQLEVLEQENARLAADFSRANITVQAMAADLRSVKQRWQATCSENAQLRQALAQVVGAGAHGEQPPLSTAVGGARSAPSSPGPGAGQVLPSQDTPLPALPLASAMAIERPCSAPTPFACSAAAELGVAQPPAPTPALSTSDAPSAFRQNQAGECLAPAPSLPSLVFEAADLGDDVAGDLAHELASEWQLDRLSSLPSFGQCFARVPSCALSDGTSRPHFHSGGSSPPSDLPHPPSSAQVEGCHLTSGAVSSSPSIARLPSISSPL